MLSLLLLFLTILLSFLLDGVTSQSCSGSTPNSIDFFIQYDEWEDESSWSLVDSSNSAQTLTTVTNNFFDYGNASATGCVADGCYTLYVYDSYGDGLTYLPGYYTLSLNDELITLGGKETFDGYDTSLYFCTSLFGSSDDTDSIELNMELNGFNGQVSILDLENNDDILYSINYENYDDDTTPNSIYIKSQCYKLKMESGYGDGYADDESYSVTVNGLLFWDEFTESSVEMIFCNTTDLIEFNVNKQSHSDILKCAEAGCEVNAQYIIEGYCMNPKIVIEILETDFSYYTENAWIHVNGEHLGGCEPLNEDCTYTWIDCTNNSYINATSGTSYVNGNTYLTVGVNVTDEVNFCAYYEDGVNYYLYSRVTLECEDIIQVNFENDRLFRHKFGCTTAGCNATAIIGVESTDICEYTLLTLKIYENDYSTDSIEYVNIYLNGQFMGECEPLNEDCSNNCDWVPCNNISGIDFTDYLVSSSSYYNYGVLSGIQFFEIKVDSTADVNFYPKTVNGTSYYVYAEAELVCADYYFKPSNNPDNSNLQVLTCDTAGCEAEGTWYVDGKCLRPTLTVDIIETDFSYYTETLTIHVNGDTIGTCEPLDADCTNEYVECSDVQNYDISSWLDTRFSLTSDIVTITLNASDAVNVCPYNGSYVYGYVNITCDYVGPTKAPTSFPTPDPTNEPTPSPTVYLCDERSANTEELKIRIGLDYWYGETSWDFIDTSNNESVMSGDASGDGSYDKIIDQTCVDVLGCYRMYLKDSYGDGMTDDSGDFGWYELSFAQNMISFNKQALNGYENQFYFCGKYFDDDGLNNITIKLSNTTKFEIFYVNETNNGTDYIKIYENNHIQHVYFESIDADGMFSHSLTLIHGCYQFKSSDQFTITYNYIYNNTDGGVSYVASDAGNGDWETEEICIGMPTSKPTMYPTFLPTNMPTQHECITDASSTCVIYDVESDSDGKADSTFGCTSAGCTATQLFYVPDVNECKTPYLSVKIYENDYSSSIEEAYIYVNGDYLGSCETLDEDCYSNCDWITCDIADALDVSDYLVPSISGVDWAVLNVTIRSTTDVNIYPYYSNGYYYYLYGEAILTCPDYVFKPGDNSEYSFSKTVQCSTLEAGCDIEKTILVDGKCVNPKLYIDILETDFLSSYEYVTMYINGDNIGTCEPLNEDCSYDMVRCNTTTDGFDLSDYLDTKFSITSDTIKITLDSAIDVNFCEYNNSYLYGKINITCKEITGPTDAPTPIPTYKPTTYPTKSPVTLTCDEDNNNEELLLFQVHYDYWPYETSWIFTDSDNNIVMRGNGSYLTYLRQGNDYDQACISENSCYTMDLYDSYGDGIYDDYGEYGFYRIRYGTQYLTFGRQVLEGYYGTFYWCGNYFDNTIDYDETEDASNNVTILLYADYNLSLWFDIYAMDKDDNSVIELIYENQFIAHDYFGSTDGDTYTVNSLILNDGCYKFTATKPFEIIYRSFDKNENIEYGVNDGSGTFETNTICVNGTYTPAPTLMPSEPSRAPTANPVTTTEMSTTEEDDQGENEEQQSTDDGSDAFSSWLGTPIGTMIAIGGGFLLFAVLLLCCYHFVIRRKNHDGEGGVAMAEIPPNSPSGSAGGFGDSHPFDPLSTVKRVDTTGQLPDMQAPMMMNMGQQTNEGGMHSNYNNINGQYMAPQFNMMAGGMAGGMNTMGMMNTMGPMNTMGGMNTMGMMNTTGQMMSPQQMQMQLALMQRMQQQMAANGGQYNPQQMAQVMQQMQMASFRPQMAGQGQQHGRNDSGVGPDLPGAMELPAAPQVNQTPGAAFSSRNEMEDDEKENDGNDGPQEFAPPAFGMAPMETNGMPSSGAGGAGAGGANDAGMAMSLALSGAGAGQTDGMMQTTGSHAGHVGEANSHLSGWESWDCSKVAQWLSFELMNNYGLDSAEEQEQVKKFIEEFKSQNIDGNMLKEIKNDKNNEYLKKLKSNFTDQSAGLWIGVKDAVNDLPDE